MFYHNISESVHKLIQLRSVRVACRRQWSYTKPYFPHPSWPVILAVPIVSAPVLALMYEYCVVTCSCALSDVTFSFLTAGDINIHSSYVILFSNLVRYFFIKSIVFLYMFRAILCSSSGGLNCMYTASGF